MKKPKHPTLVFYLCIILVGLVGVFCLTLYWKIFSLTYYKAIFTVLSDSFFVVGFFIGGTGAFILVSSTGFFDMIAYGFKTVIERFILLFNRDKNYERYYDFVERRRELRHRRKTAFPASLWTLFFVGIAFVSISALCLIFIYN